MKTYKVTFREWMYQEKEIIVRAYNKKQAIDFAEIEMHSPPMDVNKNAEWYGSKFRILKPKINLLTL